MIDDPPQLEINEDSDSDNDNEDKEVNMTHIYTLKDELNKGTLPMSLQYDTPTMETSECTRQGEHVDIKIKQDSDEIVYNNISTKDKENYEGYRDESTHNKEQTNE